MPKKKKKGKNAKNRGKIAPKRVLTFKEDMQEYAKMTKMMGDRKITVVLPDGTERCSAIPGRFRKRCWMKPGDVLLISYREFQDDKTDVIHKYTPEEVRKLVRMGEVPDFFLEAKAMAPQDDGVELGIEWKAEDDEDDNDLGVSIDEI